MKNSEKNCNSSIKCDAESCKHQNYDKGECELEQIKVTCTCDNNECDCSNDTICDSFECKEECENNEEEVEEDK